MRKINKMLKTDFFSLIVWLLYSELVDIDLYYFFLVYLLICYKKSMLIKAEFSLFCDNLRLYI